ncbi:MAG TPA: FAD-binding oxidoreductase [Thermomicrobiales bacterium]|nr:FAD-binding oxidoreductase [Thermomicrobiales bacterium]
MSASIAQTSFPLDAAAVDELAANLRGELVRPGDPAYDEARRVWNGMIDRRPAAIARCRGVADVVAGVRFAAARGLPLAVRGGGHSVAGFATCDSGLVIDLSPMRGVRVDPQCRTVRAEGGATWGDVDRETQLFGLATPGGIFSLTGIAGLTLGGGQGWMRRAYGMSCDNLISADVVTAAGELLVASDTENSDLFWALRGGGGNFGIVTSFEYRRHPVGQMVAFAGAVYPVEDAASVMAAFREFVADAPDDVSAQATWWTMPAVPAFPAAVHNRPAIVLAGVSAGPVDAGMDLLRPLRECATPILDLSSPLPYRALQQLFDPFFPAGQRHYWKSLYLSGLSDAAISEMEQWAARRPSPDSMLALWALGGAFAGVDADATAAGDRQAPYVLEVLANWIEPGESERNVAWARECCAAMERFGAGKTNLNFPGLGEDPQFVRMAVGRNYDRLVALKRRYDPTNLFRLNQNIDPRTTSGPAANGDGSRAHGG